MQDKLVIKNWLLKSQEAIKEAEISIKTDCLQSAQNRIYYAIFYAVSALAKSKGFITSKHSQLLGWFNKEYVKTQIFGKEVAAIYIESYEFRQKSDYTFSFKPKSPKLLDSLKQAKLFIEEVKKLL